MLVFLLVKRGRMSKEQGLIIPSKVVYFIRILF